MSEMVWPFSKSDESNALDKAVSQLVEARANRMVAQERLLNALQAAEAGKILFNSDGGEPNGKGKEVKVPHG